MHAFDTPMVVRDVQERASRALRRDGYTRGSQGQRRVHQDGRSVRTGTRWHEQQQLRQRRTHRRHSHTNPGPGSLGRLGSRFRESKATGAPAQEQHMFYRTLGAGHVGTR